MKHNCTYYTVSEKRPLGWGLMRLVTGDGKCDKAAGFDTIRAAYSFVQVLIEGIRSKAGVSDLKVTEKDNVFTVSYKTPDSNVERQFKIDTCKFSLFSAADVALRMIQNY